VRVGRGFQDEGLAVAGHGLAEVGFEPLGGRLRGHALVRRHLWEEEFTQDRGVFSSGVCCPVAGSVDRCCDVGCPERSVVWPFVGKDDERIGEICTGIVFILLREKELFEADEGRRTLDASDHLAAVDALFVRSRGVFDSLPNEAPPGLEARLRRRPLPLEQRIAKEDGVKRSENAAAVRLGPADRVGVVEIAVLGIGAIDLETRLQAAGGKVALWPDIVAGEQMNCRGARSDGFADAELAVRIEGGRARSLDVGAPDPGTARDVVPDERGKRLQKVGEQGLAALFFVRRPSCRGWSDAGNGHQQHNQGRSLATASSSGSNPEYRPVRQQGAFDNRESCSNQRALAVVAGRDIAKPFVCEELHGLGYGLRCAIVLLRQDDRQFRRYAEDNAALAVETTSLQQRAVDQYQRQRCDADRKWQG